MIPRTTLRQDRGGFLTPPITDLPVYQIVDHDDAETFTPVERRGGAPASFVAVHARHWDAIEHTDDNHWCIRMHGQVRGADGRWRHWHSGALLRTTVRREVQHVLTTLRAEITRCCRLINAVRHNGGEAMAQRPRPYVHHLVDHADRRGFTVVTRYTDAPRPGGLRVMLRRRTYLIVPRGRVGYAVELLGEVTTAPEPDPADWRVWQSAVLAGPVSADEAHQVLATLRTDTIATLALAPASGVFGIGTTVAVLAA